MSDTDARLVDMLDQHVKDTTGGWQLCPDSWAAKGNRIESPVEPCDRCGRKVFLMLPKGWERPVWLQLGEIKHADSLFPVITTRRHECGDGESWSVEAALFVETALAAWGEAR